MYDETSLNLNYFEQEGHLSGLHLLRHGIEKEALRVTPSGEISYTEHSVRLGSKLTHPYITTDYSEALLEFITPVFKQDDKKLLCYLQDLHVYTAHCLSDEYLWVASMPAYIQDAHTLPIAQYGNSNFGKMKMVYRQGLAHRYGKAMQMIAGIHYNFSLPDVFWLTKKNQHKDQYEISKNYFSLIRNFHRYSWLLVYLFGASPAMDRSFLSQDKKLTLPLQKLSADTLFLPWGTSLRMSDIGYTNRGQEKIKMNFNQFDDYLKCLFFAIHTSSKGYEKIGVKKNNQYLQLNSHYLQVEQEYYSYIRPKQTMMPGESPLEALYTRGVEYIEIRCLDINPCLPLGIDLQAIHFLDVFLIFCAINNSPFLEKEEEIILKNNFQAVVIEGRKPALKLQYRMKNRVSFIPLIDYSDQLFEAMTLIAETIDKTLNTHCYGQAIKEQYKKIRNSHLTPSHQVLEKIHEHGESFREAMTTLSCHHFRSFLAKKLKKDQYSYFKELAKKSWMQHQQIENNETESFDSFLQSYFKRSHSLFK